MLVADDCASILAKRKSSSTHRWLTASRIVASLTCGPKPGTVSDSARTCTSAPGRQARCRLRTYRARSSAFTGVQVTTGTLPAPVSLLLLPRQTHQRQTSAIILSTSSWRYPDRRRPHLDTASRQARQHPPPHHGDPARRPDPASSTPRRHDQRVPMSSLARPKWAVETAAGVTRAG